MRGPGPLPDVRRWVRAHLSAPRVRHIEATAETAARLAKRSGLSPHRARLAGWLHDAAKEMDFAAQTRLLRGFKPPWDALERRLPGLRHAKASAALASRVWGVRDRGVLEAVRCHTLGAPRMGRLAMVLFVADWIEPTRRFAGAARIRREAFRDLREAARQKALSALANLRRSGARVHPRLLETLRWLQRGKA